MSSSRYWTLGPIRQPNPKIKEMFERARKEVKDYMENVSQLPDCICADVASVIKLYLPTIEYCWKPIGRHATFYSTVDGVRQGKYVEYLFLQKTLECFYDKGKLSGPFTTWDRWGRMLQCTHYNRGLKHGPCRKWHMHRRTRNGKIEWHKNYYKGKLCSFVEWWYTGHMAIKATVIKDVIHVEKKWNSNGDLVYKALKQTPIPVSWITRWIKSIMGVFQWMKFNNALRAL